MKNMQDSWEELSCKTKRRESMRMKIFKTLINSLSSPKMSKLILNKTEEEFKEKHPTSNNQLKISGPMTMTTSTLDYDYNQN